MTDRARELLERALDYVHKRSLDEEILRDEIRAYLAGPRPDFVRLSEEEVNEILSLAHTPYEAICATENMLVRKNTINKSDPDSIDLQSKCRGDKL